MSLADFTTDELLEEVVRRRNVKELTQKPKHGFCEQCAHFKISPKEDDTRNPCQKGRVMQFMMPEYEYDTEYGFYRRVCADRKDRPEPPPPPVKPPETPATHMETIELKNANSPRAPRGSKPKKVPL